MNNAKDLIEKYFRGECSEEEKQFLDYWFHRHNLDKKIELTERDYLSSRNRFENFTRPRTSLLSKHIFYVAASVVILLSVGLFTFNKLNEDIAQRGANQFSKKIDEPLLRIDNQKEIKLDAVKSHDNEVTKIADVGGEVTYAFYNQKVGLFGKGKINSILTPKLHTLKTKLPDGTLVWLNASSELSFRANFNDNEERVVELKGEAYFEVAKNKEKPFKVITIDQTIEVLGTHFNVKVLDKNTATSLVEGSVALAAKLNAKRTLLKPGQHAVVRGSDYKVSSFDIDKILDWKQGDFIFKNDNLSVITTKLAEWYDIRFSFENIDIEEQTFSGRLDRSNPLQESLSILEMSCGVKFEKKGSSYSLSKKADL